LRREEDRIELKKELERKEKRKESTELKSYKEQIIQKEKVEIKELVRFDTRNQETIEPLKKIN
jgi:hypothetical protein